MRFCFLMLSVFALHALHAQTQPRDSARSRGDEWVVIGSDTVRVVELEQVLKREKYDSMARVNYMRLVRNVKRALPYAKMVAYQMQMLEDNLSRTKGRKERKNYIEAAENALKKQFEASVKDLTINQGKILMKLIHRETGKSTWEVLKSYKGSSSAFFWQTFGTFWGHDLKSEFDPVTDYQIEFIIKTYGLE